MFPGISNSFSLGGRERGVPEVSRFLIYMTMKSMILFMINYHNPEVKHKIARASLLCVDSIGAY